MSKPPVTSNSEARALIELAQSKCTGCRTVWRLKTGTFVHGMDYDCTAQTERQELRDIAAKARKK